MSITTNEILNSMIKPVCHDCQSLNWWQRKCRSLILGQARRMIGETIEVVDHDDCWRVGDQSATISPVRIVVKNPRFYWRMLSGGGLGAAESLMDGDWTCSDMPRLIRALVRNIEVLDSYDGGFARIRKMLEQVKHWLNRNTLSRSKANIREHYDLGNEFFSLFLDPTMNYSSAVFETLTHQEHPESLHRAQLRKMQRLCEMLRLSPGDHLLEIGTGWGSLACYAAKHFGCRVTTTTISHEQFVWAQNRVAAEGLEDRVTVLECDYRLLEGKYDKIVSVEMIEAVGDQFYDTFFKKCQSLLTEEGLLLLQAITIVDQRYQKHLNNVDFICKYIFPGGSLPCISRLVGSAANAAEMRMIQLNDYAAHYAETLRRWRTRFWQQIDAIRELGYTERFITMWDYYLAYCEAAFDERQINLIHVLFAQRNSRCDLTQLSDDGSSGALRMEKENSENVGDRSDAAKQDPMIGWAI
jgi:cyclopropane-fatty-acyl-phospholipid synthase